MNNTRRDELIIVNHILYDAPKHAYAYLSYADDNQASISQKITQFLSLLPLKQESRTRYLNRFSSLNIQNIHTSIKRINATVITIDDDIYPSILRELHAPPIVLYALGNTELLSCPMLGIVGSRHPSEYGKRTTALFSKTLSSYFSIVSGLAMGIDTIAHQESIDSTFSTIAILGSGFHHFYPASNKALFADISKKGLLLTEFPLTTQCKPYFFPQRNRIISGLCRGIIIPEATLKSGSLVTANLALEQNRDIFAIPGAIDSSLSEGPLHLIKEGAVCTTHPNDILLEYGIHSEPQLSLFSQQPAQPSIQLSTSETTVFEAINYSPITLDQLSSKLQKPIHEVLQYITLLEIKGVIKHINQFTITRV